jgi:hypothetical protein
LHVRDKQKINISRIIPHYIHSSEAVELHDASTFKYKFFLSTACNKNQVLKVAAQIESDAGTHLAP